MQEEYKRLLSIVQDSNNIVLFGGAGVSTESGIPDFRSSSGIYSSEYSGYAPEEILSRSFFEANPDIFYRFYRSYMIHEQAKPG
ncbi:MAG: NAD-dependent protein deacylase, partial [Oscillospiraceae bacterium]|nr:NAD-dependent protein deacylase [Oscillospiraceae bacterium]